MVRPRQKAQAALFEVPLDLQTLCPLTLRLIF